MTKAVVWAAAALAVAAGSASAQWSDNFDSYPIGSINGQGGWVGWDNTASAAGNVTNNIFRSSPNSQQIQGPHDSVRTYSGVNSGQWSYEAYQLIPSGLTTGNTYFIMLNKYNHSGPYNWSVELNFNLATGLVYDDLQGNPSPGSASIPIVRDAWVPIRVDFDLSSNTVSEYYNNVLVYSGLWTRGSASALNEFQAVDLFANNAGSVYYDDMSLTLIPAPGTAALLGAFALMGTRRRRSN